MNILKKKSWKNKKLTGKDRKYLFFLKKKKMRATGVGLLQASACYGRWPASGVGQLRASVCNERFFALNVCYERLLRASATSVEERTGNVRRKYKKKASRGLAGGVEKGVERELKTKWKGCENRRSGRRQWKKGLGGRSGVKEWKKGMENWNGNIVLERNGKGSGKRRSKKGFKKSWEWRIGRKGQKCR